MVPTSQPTGAEREPVDDYHIERDVGRTMRPAAQHVFSVLRGLLLVVLAALSFALFWVVATLLGLV